MEKEILVCKRGVFYLTHVFARDKIYTCSFQLYRNLYESGGYYETD